MGTIRVVCVSTGVSVHVSSADDTKERRGNPKDK